jgi:hypothetical protein
MPARLTGRDCGQIAVALGLQAACAKRSATARHGRAESAPRAPHPLLATIRWRVIARCFHQRIRRRISRVDAMWSFPSSFLARRDGRGANAEVFDRRVELREYLG